MPRPFQDVPKKFRRKCGVQEVAEETPMQLYLLDLM
jgi:ATP-dependent DNA ligase